MSDEDIRALARDNLIEAIRLYRERHGCGLAEAKAAVEAMNSSPPPVPTGPPGELEQQVLGLLRSKQTIQAIKLVRQRTSLGLKEAKEMVEGIAARHGMPLGSGDGRCFVATAACGADAWEVALLRWWRDERLLSRAAGWLVRDVYYMLSPPLARWIDRHARARRMAGGMIRWLASTLVR